VECGGTISVYHALIVPGGRYSIQAADTACSSEGTELFSAPLELATSRWGDLAGTFTGVSYPAPDGRVNISIDVLAILNKFNNSSGAPGKARADLDPATPDQVITILDAVQALDAFRGLLYPFAPPAWPCGG
jgi:hypothetical protein